VSTNTPKHSASGALKALRALLPDAEIIQNPSSDSDLYGGAYSDPPTLQQVRVLEGTVIRAIRVPGDPEIAFAAFLDGVQRARIVSHRNGVPIFFGTVAAAIRVRINRRLITWKRVGPLVKHGLYMPFRYLPSMDTNSMDGIDIIDTAIPDEKGHFPSRHPGALHAVAVAQISAAREALERQLAETWCATESAPLFIDGGISGSERVASAPCAVGVIKSHQTLYVKGDSLEEVMSLKYGERSSVFTVEHGRRAGVMSWYLRVRDPKGRDALFGLVRVEAALTSSTVTGDLTARANQISRWILAEVAPLALPDTRWDKMMYGVRDCEEFLRAISS
jgi:hypothetical protein